MLQLAGFFYVGSVYDRLLARVNNFRPKRLVAWISVLIELPWGLCVAFPDFQPFGLPCKSSFLPVFLTRASAFLPVLLTLLCCSPWPHPSTGS